MSDLTTVYRNNPFTTNPQGEASPVMRLVANPTSVPHIHDDIPAPTRYNVGIEFATAKGGNTTSKSSHSHAMTEDAMDLGEGHAIHNQDRKHF